MSAWTGEEGNVVRLVARACRDEPDRPALIFDDGLVVSCGQLWSAVCSFAGYLKERIYPGDRVAIMSRNRTEFMVSWLATVACRGVLVSLNPSARSEDAAYVLRDSGARIAVIEPAHAELFEELMAGCPELEEVIVMAPDEPYGLAAYPGRFDDGCLVVAPPDITNVYYTSGTTGFPKGCMIDHKYWLHFARLVTDFYEFTAADRLLCCLQFFYNDPPWQLLVSLQAGSPLIVMRRFSVSRYWNVVREHGVTILFGIASTASLLLKSPPLRQDRDHKVRLAIQVGIPSAMHRDLVERWGVPWVEAYGLTETGIVTAVPPHRAAELIGSGSIGIACPGVDVRVADAGGSELPAEAIGEIQVRGSGLLRAYLNRPDATEEAFRGGWFHTGDVGRRDSSGLFYFHGRIKDIIRRGGENVAAAEVENVLRSHAAVLEVAAVPSPDPLRGEEVKVHVLLRDGETPESVPAEELVAFCAARLAGYKVPRFVQYRSEDFERTPSMRVKKNSLDPAGGDAPGVWDRAAALGW